jgi:hypothetical protein
MFYRGMELFDGVCMANEHKPSIFNDRGSIGSEMDLDEYGVWVKSESEEFSVPHEDDSFETDFPPFDEERSSTGRTTDTAEVFGTETARPAQANADVTLSAALLLKIAGELATIKAELASLKAELDRLHKKEAESAAARISVTSAPSSPEVAAGAISTEAEVPENEVVDEAVFDDFGIEEAADETSMHNEAVEAGFFDTDEDGDKITLTSDELDLLSESVDETPEEMEDSFFAEDSDKEKIAFTDDEINNILDGTEIPDEEGDAGSFEKTTEEPFDDEKIVPETGESGDLTEKEPSAEPETARETGEKPLIEDDAFDINIETAEEPIPEDSVLTEDADIILDEEPLDIEIDDEPPEEEPETTDVTEEADLGIGTDMDITGETDLGIDTNAETDENEAVESVLETADIAFDPFGSLPDEDVLDEVAAVDEYPIEESATGLEEDSPADFTAGEEPSAEDAAGVPGRAEETVSTAENDDAFAEFPVVGETLAEEPTQAEETVPVVEDDPFADFPAVEEPAAGGTFEEPARTEENACVAEDDSLNDSFAGLPLTEDVEFDELITTDVTETEETVVPDETFIEETAQTDKIPEVLPGEAFEPEEDEDIFIEADPELSKLMDEDIRQMSPAPDDTSYLDDEKPLEFDEIAEPEPPAPFETPDKAVSLDESALPEKSVLPTEAIVPLPDGPGTPKTIPSGEESPALQGIPQEFKQELRTVLSYMDILLESLPEEKIEEFARSEHFEPYKKLFKELGLV